jgi:Mitochondrial small ribosomal subunit Rsm22
MEGMLAGSADEYTVTAGKRKRRRPLGRARVVAPCRHDSVCPMGSQGKTLGVCRFYHQVRPCVTVASVTETLVTVCCVQRVQDCTAAAVCVAVCFRQLQC